MKKSEQRQYAKNIMDYISPILPGWEDRSNKFPLVTSIMRCKMLQKKCLALFEVGVYQPAGLEPFCVSASVGWTKNLDYDDLSEIRYRPPSGDLKKIRAMAEAPEWKYKDFSVSLRRLKSQAPFTESLHILDSSVELNGSIIKQDLLDFGIPFLRLMALNRFGNESQIP